MGDKTLTTIRLEDIRGNNTNFATSYYFLMTPKIVKDILFYLIGYCYRLELLCLLDGQKNQEPRMVRLSLQWFVQRLDLSLE